MARRLLGKIAKSSADFQSRGRANDARVVEDVIQRESLLLESTAVELGNSRVEIPFAGFKKDKSCCGRGGRDACPEREKAIAVLGWGIQRCRFRSAYSKRFDVWVQPSTTVIQKV